MQPAIELQDVEVHYRIHREQIRSVKELVIRYAKQNVEYRDVRALNGITLQIQPGQVFGILGQNGAGKSTLMRILALVLPPTRGTVSVRGRIGPLLDLSSSFSPELTGTENIYLTGAILGLGKQEMQRRFDAIVDFAELRPFIDAPMRTYSSGMMARLGFAVATSVDADILLVDEVLSVGDEQFQAKCQARIGEYQRQGATIVVVSHSPDLVRKMCDRGLWLDKGQTRLLGDARDVASAYQRFLRTDAFRGTRFFHPNWFVPRAEFVRMLVQAFALPLIYPEKPTFSDITPSSPVYPYLETAYAHAWVTGFEGGPNFLPSFTITHADAVQVVRNALDAQSASPFSASVNGNHPGTGPAPERFFANTQAEGDGLTRGEAMNLIVANSPLKCVVPPQSSFADIPHDSPYYAHIETALALGLIEEWLL